MPKLFFSYSHADEELRDQLEKQLALLKRQGIIETWHDRRIGAGDEFGDAISAHLESADIIMLLISNDFLASDYCYELEMQRAMERHRSGTAVVIPVILRACDWHSAPFGKLMATPTDGKPITLWKDRDEALLQVSRAVRDAANRIAAGAPFKSSLALLHPHNPRELKAALKIARQKYIYNRRFNSSYTAITKRYGRDVIVRLANDGDANSLIFLAHSIYSDFSDDDDESRHAVYLSYVMMASEINDAEAMAMLAGTYSGNTLEKNPKKALALLRKSMDLEHPEGFLAMGRAYQYEHHGLTFDLDKTLSMYRGASARGSQLGTLLLGKLLRRVDDTNSENEGRILIESAAKEGLIEAKMELAFLTIGKDYEFKDSAFIMKLIGVDITDEGRVILKSLLKDPDLRGYDRSNIKRWLKSP